MANLMRIKLVVGELKALADYDRAWPPKNGFHRFMQFLVLRGDDASGELDLDNEDMNKLSLYAKRGHKRTIWKIFGRTLGPWL
jgi:hypothetical protein